MLGSNEPQYNYILDPKVCVHVVISCVKCKLEECNSEICLFV